MYTAFLVLRHWIYATDQVLILTRHLILNNIWILNIALAIALLFAQYDNDSLRLVFICTSYKL